MSGKLSIYFSGNPLNRKRDKTTIFSEHHHMPSGDEWVGNMSTKHPLRFINHLYFLTMDVNGFSYFYPNIAENYNQCRFEWHYDYKDKPHFLRVGLCFKVKKSKIYDVKYYFQRQEAYENLKKICQPFLSPQMNLGKLDYLFPIKLKKQKKG